MKTPYQCCSLLLRNDIFSMEWHGRRGYACLVRYALHSTLGAVPRATRRSYPVDGNVITPRSRAGDLATGWTTAGTVRSRSRGSRRARPQRQSCMLNVTLLIHSVLLLSRRTASSEADVCEEFNGGSGFRSAAVTCGWRDAGETQRGARGSRVTLPGPITLRDVRHGLFSRELGMSRRYLMFTSDSSAPRRAMVAPPQQVALTRVNVHAPAVATVHLTDRQS